jgi:hypothetical protein
MPAQEHIPIPDISSWGCRHTQAATDSRELKKNIPYVKNKKRATIT